MDTINRRNLLTGTAMLAGLSTLGTRAQADVPAGRDPFDYEVTRTDDEWRAMLGDDYRILREGGTEQPKSSPLWEETRAGAYNCRGCDLQQYAAFTKVVLPKGWVFFTASESNNQLMSQDSFAEMSDNPEAYDVTIEVHCRRCGCHMGHILTVKGRTMHCINGAALNFVPAPA